MSRRLLQTGIIGKEGETVGLLGDVPGEPRVKTLCGAVCCGLWLADLPSEVGPGPLGKMWGLCALPRAHGGKKWTEKRRKKEEGVRKGGKGRGMEERARR